MGNMIVSHHDDFTFAEGCGGISGHCIPSHVHVWLRSRLLYFMHQTLLTLSSLLIHGDRLHLFVLLSTYGVNCVEQAAVMGYVGVKVEAVQLRAEASAANR